MPVANINPAAFTAKPPKFSVPNLCNFPLISLYPKIDFQMIFPSVKLSFAIYPYGGFDAGSPSDVRNSCHALLFASTEISLFNNNLLSQNLKS